MGEVVASLACLPELCDVLHEPLDHLQSIVQVLLRCGLLFCPFLCLRVPGKFVQRCHLFPLTWYLFFCYIDSFNRLLCRQLDTHLFRDQHEDVSVECQRLHRQVVALELFRDLEAVLFQQKTFFDFLARIPKQLLDVLETLLDSVDRLDFDLGATIFEGAGPEREVGLSCRVVWLSETGVAGPTAIPANSS